MTLSVCAVAVLSLVVYRSMQPTWSPELEPYVAFVEEARGLEFTDSVEVRRGDVSAELAAGTDLSDEVVQDYWAPWQDAYQMLGLFDPEQNLAAATTETTSQGAYAFYDSLEKVIVLPEGEIEGFLELTVVHELTHALQDQHGLLDFSREKADAASMRRALVEGDADRIEMMWFDQLPEAEQRAMYADDGVDDAPPMADDFLTASFLMPYVVGDPITRLLIRTQGEESFNELLRQSTLGSTELLLDPFSTSPRPRVNAGLLIQDPNGEIGSYGEIGPVGLFRVFAPIVGTEMAFDAAIGYDNDAFTLFFTDDDAVCVRYRVWFDTAAEADEFAAMLPLAGVESERLAADGHVSEQFDLCGPIGNPADQGTHTLLPIVLHAELTDHHLAMGVPAGVARCAARSQAVLLEPTPEAFAAFTSDWDSLIADSVSHLDGCR
jgi:hypothetical protein